MKKICIILSLSSLANINLVYAETQRAAVEKPDEVKVRGITQTGLYWLKKPYPNYHSLDLQGKDRNLVVKIYADREGKIQNVKTIQSSGLPKLDQLVEASVLRARFKPYIEME